MSLSVLDYCINFVISLVAVTVSTYLHHCCLWPFGLFYVAVSRPNAVLEFWS